jgi:hypothetical protein
MVARSFDLVDKTKDSLTKGIGFKSRWHKQVDLMQSKKTRNESKVNAMVEKDFIEIVLVGSDLDFNYLTFEDIVCTIWNLATFDILTNYEIVLVCFWFKPILTIWSLKQQPLLKWCHRCTWGRRDQLKKNALKKNRGTP